MLLCALQEGEREGMFDHSVCLHRLHRPIDTKTIETIIALRCLFLCGKYIAVQFGV